MAYLEIKKGKALLQSLLDEEAMSIGRLPGNSIVINDPDISRRHCVIERWEGRYSIYDLGSRNGTKVNGERIQRTELSDGDVITIGTTTIKFVEAGMSAPGRKRPLHRSVAWGVAIIVVLIAGFIAAWASGLLGEDFAPADLKQRLGLRDSDDDSKGDERFRDNTADESRGPPALPDENGPSEDTGPLPAPGDIETSLWADRYQSIAPETLSAQRARLAGRPASARFVGKPVLDNRGELLWELPPDGAVTAVIAPADAEAQGLLDVLMAEPLLVEAELAGLLEEDRSRGRMLLRVGVMEILHAWGGKDESLQPATQRIMHQRLILNPRYIAQALAARGE
jgi:hypothetical protein